MRKKTWTNDKETRLIEFICSKKQIEVEDVCDWATGNNTYPRGVMAKVSDFKRRGIIQKEDLPRNWSKISTELQKLAKAGELSTKFQYTSQRTRKVSPSPDIRQRVRNAKMALQSALEDAARSGIELRVEVVDGTIKITEEL